MEHNAVNNPTIKAFFIFTLVALYGMSCEAPDKKDRTIPDQAGTNYISYADDVAFLKNYMDVIELVSPSANARIALSAALQGRVMTSTSGGAAGRSYGWINREHFISGDTLDHINPFGGEERFWLGPESGQFSLFFDSTADQPSWKTPRLLDLEPFWVSHQEKDKVVFTKKATLKNYSGFTFNLAIEREIAMLSRETIARELELEDIKGLQMVGYRSTNTLKNEGDVDWRKETGLLSIWLLGMYPPTATATVVIPYKAGNDLEMGVPVNDAYLDGVPAERLIVDDNVIYFRADGRFRSKIGLLPQRAKDVLGSWDDASGVLTIVKYNKPESVTDYVNSLGDFQNDPYAGDVINSYNDGPSAPGEKPLGPFYELETSSPALALKAGESGIHIQWTVHFEGDEAMLSKITKKLLKVSLEEIKTGFETLD